MHTCGRESIQYVSRHNAVHWNVEESGNQVLCHTIDKRTKNRDEQVICIKSQHVTKPYKQGGNNAFV